MKARHAFQFLYTECVRGQDDDAKLRIDAILGDEAAEAEIATRRARAVDEMDIEVG